MTIWGILSIIFLIFVVAPVSVSFYYWVRDIERDVERIKKEREPK